MGWGTGTFWSRRHGIWENLGGRASKRPRKEVHMATCAWVVGSSGPGQILSSVWPLQLLLDVIIRSQSSCPGRSRPRAGWDQVTKRNNSPPGANTIWSWLGTPKPCSSVIMTITTLGSSLVVQWLRLCILNARGPSSNPDQGTRIPHATRKMKDPVCHN